MPDTLSNTPISKNTWIDLYAESGIDIGRQLTVNNVGASDIFLVVSATEPTDEGSYIALRPRDLPFINNVGDSGLWAFSGNCEGLVNVSAYQPVQSQPLETAFGEASVAEPTPVVQVLASYGLTKEMMPIVSGGGSFGAEDGVFFAESGTNASGLSSLNTLKQLSYRAGEGALCRITSVFSEPQPDSLQAAGLITSEDSFSFGYIGLDFGIIYSRGGVVEFQELTVTDAANDSQTATITIDDIEYTVPLTSGSEEHNAYEIAQSLTEQVSNYLISSNENVVAVMALLPSTLTGAFDFSSTGNAIATFEQINNGKDPVISLINRNDFNRDTISWLNPQLGNVYFISIQYLGFGGIEFSVEEPTTRKKLVVHVIEYANTSITPSVGNPTFRIGWLARNLGNTTNLRVSGSSCAGFIEGKKIIDNAPTGFDNKITNVGTTFRNIITIRNRFHFGDRINRAPALIALASIGSDSAKGMEFLLIKNAEFEDDVNYLYRDKGSSILEYTYDSVEITEGSGENIIPFFEILGGETINLKGLDLNILPDDQITLAVADVQLSNTGAIAGLSICEDL